MGNVHDGIRQMFHVIEQARMAVGMKSMSTLSTAYLGALEYAKDRVQGADLKQASDKRAPRVRIIQHPDVRRMLMAQKTFAEGLRALALFAATTQDQVEILGGHGAAEAGQLDALNDFLLPLVKGYSSEKATEMLVLSLQTIGGSGYIQDFPFEQYLRDQKIDSLYEGTTHIQAQDLFFRKIARDGGKTLEHLLEQIGQTLESNAAWRGARRRSRSACARGGRLGQYANDAHGQTEGIRVPRWFARQSRAICHRRSSDRLAAAASSRVGAGKTADRLQDRSGLLSR